MATRYTGLCQPEKLIKGQLIAKRDQPSWERPRIPYEEFTVVFNDSKQKRVLLDKGDFSYDELSELKGELRENRGWMGYYVWWVVEKNVPMPTLPKKKPSKNGS